MGAGLETCNPFAYDHWMPDEEPTFYIPRELNLTPQQSEELQRAGIRQGEPFILTQDGRVARPAFTTTSLRGYYDCFSIQPGTTQMFEEEAGKYSLEFKYFTPMPVLIEVYINAMDASDGTTIKLGRTMAKWGPFSLPASSHIPPFSTAPDAGYKKWSSKRYSLQPLNTPALVEESQLSTVHHQGEVQPGVYDIVLVVTPRYPSAPPPTVPATNTSTSSSAKSPTSTASTHLSPRQIEVSRMCNSNTKHSGKGYQKVRPVDAQEQSQHSGAQVQPSARDRNPGTRRDSTGQSGHYELVTVAGDDHQDGTQQTQRRAQQLHTVSVRGESTLPAGTVDGVETCANIDPTEWVKKEAFFFRVNYDSFQKRHAVTRVAVPAPSVSQVSTGSKIISTGDQLVLVGEDSVHSAAVKGRSTSEYSGSGGRIATTSGGVFMRSKAVSLDCALQLLQIDSDEVYSRLTLYGIEGFRFPIGKASSSDPGQTNSVTGVGGVENAGAQAGTEPSSIVAPRSAPTSAAAVSNSYPQPSPAEAALGAECIICLSNPQTTIMFPCRHLCLCDQCASELASRASGAANNTTAEKKCPVCRRPVIVMFQLKVR